MEQLQQSESLMKRFSEFIVGLIDDCKEGGLVLTQRQHCIFHICQEFDLMSLRNIESKMKLMRSVERGEAAQVIVARLFDFDRNGKLIWIKTWTKNFLETEM